MFNKLLNWIKHSDDKELLKTSENLSTSYTEHILIDYENLLPQNLDKIPRSKNTHIWLFVGSHQTKLNTGLVRSMQDFEDRAHQIYLDISYKQPSTLDFILSYYLGYIAAIYPQAHVAILSKYKGYKMVIDHALKSHNFSKLTHYDNNDYVEEKSKSLTSKLNTPSSDNYQPITIKTPASPFGQAFREAIIYLTDSDKYHPRIRERLENLFAKEIVMPIFSSQEENFTEENALNQARKLVDQLRVSRLIELEDKDIGLLVYHVDEKSLYQRMKYFILRKKPKHVVLLKEMIAYNYSHREINNKEIESLIEQLKKENIFYIIKGGHIKYIEESLIDIYDVDKLVKKAIEFLKIGHGLPRNKSSLYNVIGTHTNTKDNDKALQIIVDHLIHQGLIKFNGNQVFYPQNSSD